MQGWEGEEKDDAKKKLHINKWRLQIITSVSQAPHPSHTVSQYAVPTRIGLSVADGWRPRLPVRTVRERRGGQPLTMAS